MKRFGNLLKPVSVLIITIFLLLACNTTDSIVEPDEIKTDFEALQKITFEDEVLNSFEPNYDEEEAMELFGGTLAKAIYPVRVGHKMRLVDRNLEIEFVGDTAVGVMTKTFEGVLMIAASYEEFTLSDGHKPDSSLVDTLIEKNFTTVITTNVKYAKFSNTRFPERNWKIIAVSLPEGGTGSPNIVIQKMTIYLPNDEVIVIDSPNDYFLERLPGRGKQMPKFKMGDEVTVSLELLSIYPDTDFVSLTYGAFAGGKNHRVKKRFELVSEEQSGGVYLRTYEQSWNVRSGRGHKHAIINALPKQVLFDDEAIVEEHSWGMPYAVK
jgi:hypothetical protein